MSRLSRIHSDLDRLFDEAMRLASREPRAGEHEPPVDVMETAEEVVVLIEVPGLSPDEIELFVEGRAVVVAGVKRLRPPDGARRFHGIEREQGRFERRVEMLCPVNTHRGRARLAAGLLTVTFPRVEEKRLARRPVPIEVVGPPDDAGDETT